MAPSYLPLATQDVDDTGGDSLAPVSNLKPAVHMATTTLQVKGMTCGACTSAVESGFTGVDGVGNVSVSLVMDRAVVQHNPVIISAEQIKEIIDDCGFDAQVLSSDTPLPPVQGFQDGLESEEEQEEGQVVGMLAELPISTTTVAVGGMTCGACTSAVEAGFKIAGVKSFSISLLAERAVIEHDTSILSVEKVLETIEDTGFDAKLVESKLAVIARPKKTQKKQKQMARAVVTTIAIEGMTCGACTSAVEGGFQIPGVLHFNISLLAERAMITHDPKLLSVEQVVEIIEDRGFGARLVSSQDVDAETSAVTTTAYLKMYGLSEQSDATNLESTIKSLNGVTAVNFNMITNRATITYRTTAIGLRNIVETIEEAGYNALVAETDDNNAQLESLAKTKEMQEWRRAFRISLSFAIPVFLTSMVFPMFLKFLDYGSIPLPIPGLWLGDVVCMALTIPVQFGIGRRFYRSAYKSVLHGSPTMDVLVVLGTSAAFFFSVAAMVVSVLTPPHTRPATVFDTSTMLITFITLGRLLENGAKSQTSRALSRLMSLAPSMAAIYVDPIAAEKLYERTEEVLTEKPGDSKESRGDYAQERLVPTELLQVGDIVILRPGDKVPADGLVVMGESYVDESMVTGEAMPIYKKQGSMLMAGTVNGVGRIDFRVTRAGRDTALSQIVRLVQEAQTSRAPIQRMADLVAGYFVPVIISLGVLTFVTWMVLSHVLPRPPAIFLDHESGGTLMVCLKLCISVIVFACPCALGLSTPTAVMVGTGVGAEQGILVKGGAALETATKITHIIFDKTGTLTTGKMTVAKADIFPAAPGDSMDDNSPEWKKLWWSIVGLAESGSEHPIGKAILRRAREEVGLEPHGNFDGSVDKFEATIGKGISATIKASNGTSLSTFEVLIGNVTFLRSHQISIPIPIIASEIPNSTASDMPAAFDAPGTTNIHVALDSRYCGTLYLSDTLKTSAAATVAALRLMKIPCSIVTGDALPAALSIADLVQIPRTNVHASATPSQKQSFVKSMQSAGHVVAMVGDGINDSPALATADVGISLSSGTDVAMEAADIVLMRSGSDDLLDVAASLHLARHVFRRIKINLAWACGYNLIGLPFAMGMFLPWGLSLHPMAAGAAMAASSVSVVVSSLLLKFWHRPAWMDVGALQKDGQVSSNTWTSWTTEVLSSAKRALPQSLSRKSRGKKRAEYAQVPLSDLDAV